MCCKRVGLLCCWHWIVGAWPQLIFDDGTQVTMHSILWNAALPAKKGDSLAYSYAGMSTVSTHPEYHKISEESKQVENSL